jgi:glycosyltransferase involved in cell wall biosynthesis
MITAGGAGMICGSCLHDSTWAKAMLARGHEATLVPCYTPLRLDDATPATSRIFIGGINLYLEQKYPLLRSWPLWSRKWLDHPRVLALASRFSVSAEAKELGEIALSMLRGAHGPHTASFEELADYISTELRPDVVFFSNALMSGPLVNLRAKFSGPIICMLQGDDIFLDGLLPEYRQQAIDQIRENSRLFDSFVTHSEYYADHMSSLLGLERQRFGRLPLAVDTARLMEHVAATATGTTQVAPKPRPVIGYFARICPEKGLHQLVEAGLALQAQGLDFEIRAAGYLPASQKTYLRQVLNSAAPLGDRFQYLGSPPTIEEKNTFLKSLDIFSVPTTYREPKGIFLLEAWAHRLPVVQPAHGAFPEMLQNENGLPTGGLLFTSHDPTDLAEKLAHLINHPTDRVAMGQAGFDKLHDRHDLAALGQATEALLERWRLERQTAPASAKAATAISS